MANGEVLLLLTSFDNVLWGLMEHSIISYVDLPTQSMSALTEEIIPVLIVDINLLSTIAACRSWDSPLQAIGKFDHLCRTARDVQHLAGIESEHSTSLMGSRWLAYCATTHELLLPGYGHYCCQYCL